MLVSVKCKECKCKHRLVYGDLKKKDYQIDGKTIFLTYYDCPKCGKRNCVQIDDLYSLGLLQGCSEQLHNLLVMKRAQRRNELDETNEFLQEKLKIFTKAQRELTCYRNKLEKMYAGKKMHDEDMDFVLRFDNVKV